MLSVTGRTSALQAVAATGAKGRDAPKAIRRNCDRLDAISHICIFEELIIEVEG